jgi:hypothetical protein
MWLPAGESHPYEDAMEQDTLSLKSQILRQRFVLSTLTWEWGLSLLLGLDLVDLGEPQQELLVEQQLTGPWTNT